MPMSGEPRFVEAGGVAGDNIYAHMITDREHGTGRIIAACVEQGGQAYETFDARRIAHSLEYGCARETRPDRTTPRERGHHEHGFGVCARQHGFNWGYARARIL